MKTKTNSRRLPITPGLLTAFFVLSVACASSVRADDRTQGKKVIEWGWGEPDTKFLRENIVRLEELPFDGIVYHITTEKGEVMMWELWGDRRFELAQVQQAVKDLQATKFQRWTDCFLRVNIMPGSTDWFDDKAWDNVAHNFEVSATVAKQGGSKGLMFDTEQYNETLAFDYAKQPHRGSKSFAVYQAQVRQRGRQWMQAVNRGFPDVTILLTFGYAVAMPKDKKLPRSESGYGLLADFLDGALEVCSPTTKFVDAWEFSYGYKKPEEFTGARRTILEESLSWTAVKAEYREHVSAGFGLWMDNQWRKNGWNTTDFSKNYFTPAEFEGAVEGALAATDRYVWIYTEQPKWYKNENLPAPYVDALRNAIRKSQAQTSARSSNNAPAVR